MTVDPLAYASNLVDALTGVLLLPPVSERVLFQSLVQLYKQHGVLDGGNHHPVLIEWREAVATNRNVPAQIRSAITTRFDSLLLSMPDALRIRSGWKVADLSCLCLCLEMDDIGSIDQDFWLNVLLLKLFMQRIASGTSNAKLSTVLMLDEAGRVLGRSGSAISSMIGLVRGAGIALVLSNQSADVSSAILSNTPFKILGLVSNPADVNIMKGAMGLSTEQAAFVQQLKPGEFIMTGPVTSWPILLRVPLVKVPQKIGASFTDCPDLAPLPVIEAVEYRNWCPDWLAECHTEPSETEHANFGTTPLSETKTSLSDLETQLLRIILSNQGIRATDLPKQMHKAASTCVQLRKSLVSKGLIHEEHVQQGRGRPTLKIWTTEQAQGLFG